MKPLRNRIRVLPGRRRMPSSIRVARGVYLLPNLVTSGGLFCGFYAIISTFKEEHRLAAIAILIALVFDVLDGRVARMTKSSSRFGVEYDSLSDVVAFGVAPGVLAYRWALEPWGAWGWLAASLYVICGALRLARFNAQADMVDKGSFVGLPIPAAAGVIATTILMYYFLGGEGTINKHITFLLLIYALAGLMVSTIPYFSFKELPLGRRQPFWLLILGIILIQLTIAEPQLMLFILFACYALSGPLRAAVRFGRGTLTDGRSEVEEVLPSFLPQPRALDSDKKSSL